MNKVYEYPNTRKANRAKLRDILNYQDVIRIQNKSKAIPPI